MKKLRRYWMEIHGSSNMKRNIEKAIQRAVVDFVRKSYPQIIIHATSNEHSYDKHNDYCVGIPDLLLFSPCGKVLFLELKTLTGKLNKNQIAWNKFFDKNFTASNYKRAVAYGFIQAQEIIADWHIT